LVVAAFPLTLSVQRYRYHDVRCQRLRLPTRHLCKTLPEPHPQRLVALELEHHDRSKAFQLLRSVTPRPVEGVLPRPASRADQLLRIRSLAPIARVAELPNGVSGVAPQISQRSPAISENDARHSSQIGARLAVTSDFLHSRHGAGKKNADDGIARLREPPTQQPPGHTMTSHDVSIMYLIE
jgi:hypothetical protein